MKAFIGAKIHDPKTDKLLEDYGFKEAHSFVSNFIKALFVYTTASAGFTLFDVGNVARAITAAHNVFNVLAAANTTSSGIIIGSGTNVPTLGDYNLQTQITTNVYHLGVNAFLNSPSNSSMELMINRTFMNNTGSTLTINEIGLVGLTTSTWNILLARVHPFKI